MIRLTKIVATIGPASDNEKDIERLIEAGVDVIRFNFKHSTVDWHNERIKRVYKVAEKLKRPIGTLIDLQGPEIRINMPKEELELQIGERILISDEVFVEKIKGISISHPDVIPQLTEGQLLIADDGNFVFKVEIEGNKRYLVSEVQGVLKNRKSLNIPGSNFAFPVLIEKDFEGLKLVQKRGVDFVALSFVRTVDDIKTLRAEMNKYKVKAQVISKIETKLAIDNLDKIIDVSDGVMVARGDLGVELPIEQVPYFQKLIIKRSVEKGKPVITATEMLQSMVSSPRPTRAEVSDIANSTYDLSDAVMLSGETASGAYPLKSVNVMCKTVVFNEKKFEIDTRERFNFELNTPENLICNAAYDLYLKIRNRREPITGFVVLTQSGKTAKLLSMFRPLLPIYALCPNQGIAEKLMLNFAVQPVIYKNNQYKGDEVSSLDIRKGIKYLLDKKIINKGDRLIIIHGDYWEKVGGTSTVKLVACA